MVNLKRVRAKGQLKGNLAIYPTLLESMASNLGSSEGPSQPNESYLSAPESPARFNREEMLGNLLLPISKFIADDFTPANDYSSLYRIKQCLTLHAEANRLEVKTDLMYSLLLLPRGKLIFS